MKKVLTSEIKMEKCNAQAVGAFNAAISSADSTFKTTLAFDQKNGTREVGTLYGSALKNVNIKVTDKQSLKSKAFAVAVKNRVNKYFATGK